MTADQCLEHEWLQVGDDATTDATFISYSDRTPNMDLVASLKASAALTELEIVTAYQEMERTEKFNQNQIKKEDNVVLPVVASNSPQPPPLPLCLVAPLI